MKGMIHLLVVLALVAGFTTSPAYAVRDCGYDCTPLTYACPCPENDEVDSPPGEFILMDALILRPLGMLSMVVGGASAIVSAPWGATSCTTHRINKELIQKPWNYTFARPLGEEEYERDRH